MDSNSLGDQTNSSENTDTSLGAKFADGLRLDAISGDEHPELKKIGPKEVDALYSRDMNKLSLKERDSVLHDIHGIADKVDETPEFVQEKRQQLKEELLHLTTKKTCYAYHQSLSDNHDYVTSEVFELMFLRSDLWDPKLSAAKIITFLEAKLEMFGPDHLTKDIRISEMKKDDKKSLESGFFQLLSVRDVAGRAIICGVPMLRKYGDLKNLVRAFFYLVMVALEDPETQRNGIVMVGLNTGKDRNMNRSAAWAVQKLARLLPMRLVGIHFCYDDFMMLPMMSLAMLVMGASRRVRFRAHYGKMTGGIETTQHIPCLSRRVSILQELPTRSNIPFLHSASRKVQCQLPKMEIRKLKPIASG